jgi:hypothetical protein
LSNKLLIAFIHTSDAGDIATNNHEKEKSCEEYFFHITASIIENSSNIDIIIQWKNIKKYHVKIEYRFPTP